MAYTSGTAANYKDLLAILATFAAANGWVILEQSATRLCLKGTGLSGLDEIYANIVTYEDAGNGRYNWDMAGAWGWRSGRTLDRMPRSSMETVTNRVVAHFWNNAIPYWMVANGRRIILVAKVSSTYQHVHLGLLSPPATDAQYPYPLFIGGGGRSLATNYSSTIAAYWSYEGDNYYSGRLCYPGGVWGSMLTSGPIDSHPGFAARTFNETQRSIMLPALDGTYLLEPLYLQNIGAPGIMGGIEGLYRVSGYNNTSENIITVDGVNHMVFQNGSRTGFGDYCALRMN